MESSWGWVSPEGIICLNGDYSFWLVVFGMFFIIGPSSSSFSLIWSSIFTSWDVDEAPSTNSSLRERSTTHMAALEFDDYGTIFIGDSLVPYFFADGLNSNLSMFLVHSYKRSIRLFLFKSIGMDSLLTFSNLKGEFCSIYYISNCFCCFLFVLSYERLASYIVATPISPSLLTPSNSWPPSLTSLNLWFIFPGEYDYCSVLLLYLFNPSSYAW